MTLRVIAAIALCGSIGCGSSEPPPPPGEQSERFERARKQMVDRDIAARGIRDPRVLSAMAAVSRHLFVDGALRDRAYDDQPLPIGHDQTISQPYIVALMTEAGAARATQSGGASDYPGRAGVRRSGTHTHREGRIGRHEAPEHRAGQIRSDAPGRAVR